VMTPRSSGPGGERTTAAPLTVVQVVHILWSGECSSNHGGNPLRIVVDCLRDSIAVQGLCPIMTGHDSLTKRLCQVSPYAGCIEPIIDLIPEIMERNDQLRPLWTAWRQNATPDLTPRQYFTRSEIKVLCDFVEFLYFASDAFARSARTGR